MAPAGWYFFVPPSYLTLKSGINTLTFCHHSQLHSKSKWHLENTGGHGGLVVKSRPRDRRVARSKPNSTEDCRVWGLLHAKSYVVAKCPPIGVAQKFGEGVPAQVSSLSSDCGSKLRGPSLNSPHVASKRDVNLT
ncbi:hypothetical protein AVEN_55025-1 [Araneus ventricosus]|uniref:Uncharacterized protein n=1 Tax=Araneus ventricosus TaxID=182803 RepID=A0A4Y2PKP2_ARAVE|nr:hypothetical protein AVEN_55025-1 [Araneus ventricosus]